MSIESNIRDRLDVLDAEIRALRSLMARWPSWIRLGTSPEARQLARLERRRAMLLEAYRGER